VVSGQTLDAIAAEPPADHEGGTRPQCCTDDDERSTRQEAERDPRSDAQDPFGEHEQGANHVPGNEEQDARGARFRHRRPEIGGVRQSHAKGYENRSYEENDQDTEAKPHPPRAASRLDLGREFHNEGSLRAPRSVPKETSDSRSEARMPATTRPHRQIPRAIWWASVLAGTALFASACANAVGSPTASTTAAASPERSWDEIVAEAQGQSVSLWMWGGDPQGNAYVDDILTPAAAQLGVTLTRVPIADTKDAINQILAEKQAGRRDGSVDLVWVNGDNFRTGLQGGIWRCDWADDLPSARFTAKADPLLVEDFGTPVNGCESPWHKAQFTFVYDSARVPEPPRTMSGLLDWIRLNPGRFTYPAPPDFTGSVFIREALYATSGGYTNVPSAFSPLEYDALTPPLWQRLNDLRRSLWRLGETYPKDSTQLDELFASGQVDFTMTYGPATLTALVANGIFPETTRVLPLDEGTIGNASFLAIPITSAHAAGAQVVANLALSPAQQAIKADPRVWGQFTALDITSLPPKESAAFAGLPSSPIVPPYDVLSRNAQPEVSAEWVRALDEGWRRNVLTPR